MKALNYFWTNYWYKTVIVDCAMEMLLHLFCSIDFWERKKYYFHSILSSPDTTKGLITVMPNNDREECAMTHIYMEQLNVFLNWLFRFVHQICMKEFLLMYTVPVLPFLKSNAICDMYLDDYLFSIHDQTDDFP